MKLATDDQNDKWFLLTSELYPQGVMCPFPYICIKTGKNMYDIRLQRDIWNLQQMTLKWWGSVLNLISKIKTQGGVAVKEGKIFNH